MTIDELRYIRARLAELCQPEAIDPWLHTGVPELEGERPIELIERGEGVRVLRVIEQLADGVFV